MSIEVLSQDELPPLHEVAHRKVVVEKVLNQKLEHLVVELEGEGSVDQHPLHHLVQAAGCRWRAKSVESQKAGGILERYKIQQKEIWRKAIPGEEMCARWQAMWRLRGQIQQGVRGDERGGG